MGPDETIRASGGGVHAGRDVTINGDVDMSATVYAHGETTLSELDDKLEQLFDALGATGAWRDPSIGGAAAELSIEVARDPIRPAKVTQLLDSIAGSAADITVVVAAVEAIRLALGL